MKFIVTGAAGFIGSHLVSELLRQGASKVVGVDNLWTGHTANLQAALAQAGGDAASRFEFVEQDIREYAGYARGDIVYHLAALASVPRSMEKPLETHQANVDGFFVVMNRARKLGVKRMIYASSSSVYGNCDTELQHEDIIGDQLNPYAATKRINEIYAEAFRWSYGFESVGLRFFNVYGPRQRADSAYASVIPKWIDAMMNKKPVEIYGDGSQVRDFTFVSDIVQGLSLARFCPAGPGHKTIFNLGTGNPTTLLHLFAEIRNILDYPYNAMFKPRRLGDKHISAASLAKAKSALLYSPEVDLPSGLRKTVEWMATQ